MISPEELFDKKLEKGRGYDKKEVDDFLQQLFENYQEVYRKNVELQDQIHTLNNGLQHYKTIETSLQKALILAEKTADETIQTAKLKAQSIIREAENKAQMFTADSRAELEAVHGKTIGLMQEYVRYKAQFNKLIQEQIELLNGSRFEIQTDDLLAFQKMTDDDASIDSVAQTDDDAEEDTQPLNVDSVLDSMPKEDETGLKFENVADSITFSDVQEEDTSFKQAVTEKIPEEETDSTKETSSMNQLDYLNAAEKFNEQAFEKMFQQNK